MVIFTNRKSYRSGISDVVSHIINNKMIFECNNEKYIDFCTVKDIVLREKDLNDDEYAVISIEVQSLLKDSGINLYVRSINAAKACGTKRIHMSYKDYVARETTECNSTEKFIYSISVHSIDEARKCEALGANRLVTGHVFATDCKRDLEPRGIEFIKSIVEAVDIPVVAIGGILPENYIEVTKTGVNDIAVMSYINQFNFC